MIQYIRHLKILIAFLAIANIHNIILANDEIKRERPGKLFSPAKIPLLEDPGRDKWQKPEEILNLLDIKKGQYCCRTIGAGSGYLTVNYLSVWVQLELFMQLMYSRKCWTT